MEKKDNLTKTLAVAGTTLILMAVIAPIFFSITALISNGRFVFDFIMPAELFPLVLIGSALLIFAAVRAKSRRKLIIWSFAIGIVMLFGGQALAVATGLASGEIEPTGIWWGLTLGSLIVFDLAVVATCVGGFLLIVELYKRPAQPSGALPAEPKE